MSELRLILFDDGIARRWAPFSLTRPIGELLFGCMTLRARAEAVFGVACEGHVARRALVGFDEPDAPPGIGLDELDLSRPTVLLSSRAAPAFQELVLPEVATRLTIHGEPVGWVIPASTPMPSELWIRDPSASSETGPVLAIDGDVLARPWDLLARNNARTATDVAHLWTGDVVPGGVFVVGDGAVSLAPGAVVEAGVVLDVRAGPNRLDSGVRIDAPARLTGPLFIGRDSHVFGGSVGTSSIGPVCRVRGEVSDSVLIGYANKAHDGYLGHALLGRWVNLGAMTTNSDLKNNYGTVRIWTPDGTVDTGLMKVGCFLGDHVRTGIGTLLNTGSVLGAGCNVFGGAMPPNAVPPFSWGAGSELQEYRLDKFLETAERAMNRRDVELTPGVRSILEKGWHATAPQRSE